MDAICDSKKVPLSYNLGGMGILQLPKYMKPYNKSVDFVGADIYVGSHPHRLQPVEYYNGKYIIYSESNFCFGGQPWLSDPDTAIFQCTFSVFEGKVVGNRMECIPFSMRSTSSGNDYCPMPYEKGTEEYDRVMEKRVDEGSFGGGRGAFGRRDKYVRKK